MKRNLDVLRDGLEQLGVCGAELTPEANASLSEAARVRDHELSQLRQMEALSGVEDDAALLTDHLAGDRPWREASQLVPAAARIRARYAEVRRGLLNKQNAEAEAARGRVKTRPGYAQLNADQGHHVLRPIAEVMVDTTPDAVAPTLVEVRDGFASRIDPAAEQANDRLDDALSKETVTPVVKLDAHLRGREVASREQLGALLKELEDRIGPLVDQGARVRLV